MVGAVHLPGDGRPGRERNICIIGVGNEHRRDDGVGIWVARQIAAARWDGATVVASNAGDSVALLSAWKGAKVAYLIDAVCAEIEPGAIIRLDSQRHPSMGHLRSLSSHGLGIVEAIELGRALEMLPERLIIYGIAGRSFEHGEGLSPEVERAARKVIGRLHRVTMRGRLRICTSDPL